MNDSILAFPHISAAGITFLRGIMNSLLKTTCSAFFALGLGVQTSWAETPRILTWNINGGEQDKDILASNARQMLEDVGDFDILVLQEVISSQQVAEIADEIGFEHWAISDFSPPIEVTGKWFASLEVAILTRSPLLKVVEWDTTGRLPTGDPYDPRSSDTSVPTGSLEIDLSMADGEQPSRGFLRVDLENGLSVYATHWKSSRGASGDKDLKNAAKRENNARGIVIDAEAILSAGGSVIVAGDLNIQPQGKHERVGFDESEDCQPSLSNCGTDGLDGYDDSMAILAGLGSDYRLLSASLPPTYLGGNFGPGAIDHIAVAGPLAESFPDATTVSVATSSYFGSDHKPVFSGVGIERDTNIRALGLSGISADDREATVQRLIREISERLELLERLAKENQQ